MFITVTIEAKKTRFDIKIDMQQKIGESLKVLKTSGIIDNITIPNYLRSHLKQSLVSTYKTFYEEGIFSGDVLTIMD